MSNVTKKNRIVIKSIIVRKWNNRDSMVGKNRRSPASNETPEHVQKCYFDKNTLNCASMKIFGLFVTSKKNCYEEKLHLDVLS